MVKFRHFMLITAAMALAATAHAQSENGMQRITPAQADDSIMSTHKQAPGEQPPSIVSTQNSTPSFQPQGQPLPPSIQPVANPMAPAVRPPAAMPNKNPFGRGEAAKMADEAKSVSKASPATAAVPVVDVDAVEASEAAPPTPVAPGADPVAEDPAMPTELTSPIFNEDPEPGMPRKVVIRALNKVTAQSELMSIKTGDKIKFGQLEITAITCRTSAPESQTDYAGLLDIAEKTAIKDQTKPLFHGWMYASSPSISALEHPVYDVTMVECKLAIPTVKKDEKDAEKAAKKGKK